MQAIDWQKTLQDQRDKYGKTVFTVTELSNISALGPQSLKMSLSRLVRRGIMQHYLKGRYGLPGAAGVEDLVPSADASAYITGMYALYRHQLITQSPTEITCFTNRRHNKSRIRLTKMGRIVFVCVSGSVYSYPGENIIASPEQAFCDFVYLCRRRGVSPSGMVTFRNLHRLDASLLLDRLEKYPATVRRDAKRLLHLSGHIPKSDMQ